MLSAFCTGAHACMFVSAPKHEDQLLHVCPELLGALTFLIHQLLALLTDHYADDLGLDLEEAFEQDYNAKLEDGSPYEV